VASAVERRRILILKDEPSIRNLLTLVKKLESDLAAGADGKAAVANINRGQFDDVIVDIRCPQQPPKQEVSGIGEIRPSLLGRVFMATIEVSGPKMVRMVERYLQNPSPHSLFWLINHRYKSRG
jgi:CheY-like chemotaxis protein